MAKQDFDKEDGVWRTVGGRRIFIRTGQSLSDAMKESGKFSRVAKNKGLYEKTEKESKEIEDKLKGKEEINLTDKQKETIDKQHEKDLELAKKDVQEYLKDPSQFEGTKEEFVKGLAEEWSIDKEEAKKLFNEASRKENPYATNNEGGSDDNSSEFADEAIKHWEDENNKYKEKYGKDDEMASSFKERWEKEKKNREYGERKAEDNERLEIAKDIAKELNPSLKSASDERLEKEAREILSPPDGYVLDKGETTYTNANGEIERSTESLKKWQEDLKKTSESTGFTSTSTNPLYPDKDYTNEELDKMAENGVKPMKDTYSGYGWEGVNSDKNLSTSEQAKAITDTMKEKYPDVKISRKSELYSGGSSIHFAVMSSDKDLYVSDADIDNMSLQDLSDVTRSNNFNWWANENIPGYKENKAMYSEKDVKNYAKERLAQMKKGDNQSVRGNEWYLSDYGKQVMTDLNKTADSYTYDDSDAMTDYFNHGTYMWVNIGKYDKPYQVNEKTSKSSTNGTMNNILREKAYQKYMKEHPNSEMTFEEFKNKK